MATGPGSATINPQRAEEEIKAIIDSGDARHYAARDRVSTAWINVLADVMGDDNPIYRDPDAARAAGHPDIVAPPTALQVWTMNLLGEGMVESPVDRAYQVLMDNGFPNVVGVNSEQHYDRYIVAGDLLHSEERVETITGLKQTGLGPGMFITTLLTFFDEQDERVGTMRFRTLWYTTEEGA